MEFRSCDWLLSAQEVHLHGRHAHTRGHGSSVLAGDTSEIQERRASKRRPQWQGSTHRSAATRSSDRRQRGRRRAVRQVAEKIAACPCPPLAYGRSARANVSKLVSSIVCVAKLPRSRKMRVENGYSAAVPAGSRTRCPKRARQSPRSRGRPVVPPGVARVAYVMAYVCTAIGCTW